MPQLPVIDKNVPVPGPVAQRGTWTKLAMKLEVGDSTSVASNAQRCSLLNALLFLGRKGTSRREEKGYRIWRTE